MFEACENSVEDETRIIAKAAKVIRKYIVKGDVSAERQVEPVQSLLISLISLILEGRLSVDENKTELNALIADIIVKGWRDINTTVVVTRGEKVVSNHLIEKANLEP